MKPVHMFCTKCYAHGPLRKERSLRGSWATELLLWCFFLLPGIIYTSWRASGPKEYRCPKCGSTEMIPLDSNRARQCLGGVGGVQ